LGTICLLSTLLVAGAWAAAAESESPSVRPGVGPLVPDGRIVFGRWKDSLGSFEVFTIASDGSDERSLLPGAHECPRWSPDGATISVTAVSPTGQIIPAFVGADGSGYRELSADPTLHLGCSAWAPDGATLMYEAWDDADPTRAGIYTIKAADGSDLTRLTENRDIPGAYSPDGSRIVFHRMEGEETGRLWVMDADGSNARQLIDRIVGHGTRFSPDGTMILADGHDGSVFTVDVESGEVTEIPLPAGSGGYGAHWSPDGGWIVLSLHMGGEPDPDLYAVRLDGTGLIQLTETFEGREEFPDWVAP
jgi:Tol biopolymer transport system component